MLVTATPQLIHFAFILPLWIAMMDWKIGIVGRNDPFAETKSVWTGIIVEQGKLAPF
jgi:hypothetical protein